MKKFGLFHWEKERLVDLICSLYLKEILPAYQLQPKGDDRIDYFVDEYAIFNDLPSAIANYIEQNPR